MSSELHVLRVVPCVSLQAPQRKQSKPPLVHTTNPFLYLPWSPRLRAGLQVPCCTRTLVHRLTSLQLGRRPPSMSSHTDFSGGSSSSTYPVHLRVGAGKEYWSRMHSSLHIPRYVDITFCLPSIHMSVSVRFSNRFRFERDHHPSVVLFCCIDLAVVLFHGLLALVRALASLRRVFFFRLFLCVPVFLSVSSSTSFASASSFLALVLLFFFSLSRHVDRAKPPSKRLVFLQRLTCLPSRSPTV